MVRIDWRPDDAALRSFGRTVFIGFTLIGLLVWYFGGSYDAGVAGPLPWFVGLSAAVWLLAVVAPPAARPIYVVWMSVGFVMGTIISTILLAAIYWILFGFVALCFRIRKRDRLHIKSAPQDGDGWVVRSGSTPSERYRRQF